MGCPCSKRDTHPRQQTSTAAAKTETPTDPRKSRGYAWTGPAGRPADADTKKA